MNLTRTVLTIGLLVAFTAPASADFGKDVCPCGDQERCQETFNDLYIFYCKNALACDWEASENQTTFFREPGGPEQDSVARCCGFKLCVADPVVDVAPSGDGVDPFRGIVAASAVLTVPGLTGLIAHAMAATLGSDFLLDGSDTQFLAIAGIVAVPAAIGFVGGFAGAAGGATVGVFATMFRGGVEGVVTYVLPNMGLLAASDGEVGEITLTGAAVAFATGFFTAGAANWAGGLVGRLPFRPRPSNAADDIAEAVADTFRAVDDDADRWAAQLARRRAQDADPDFEDVGDVMLDGDGNPMLPGHAFDDEPIPEVFGRPLEDNLQTISPGVYEMGDDSLDAIDGIIPEVATENTMFIDDFVPDEDIFQARSGLAEEHLERLQQLRDRLDRAADSESL